MATTNGGKIEFDIGFKVNKADLESAKTQIKTVQDSLTKAMSSANSQLSTGKANNQFNEQLKKSMQTATQLESIINKAYNPKIDALNMTKFNNLLKQSGLSAKTIQTDLNAIGTTGSKAFSQFGNYILGTQVKIKGTSKALEEMGKTLSNSLRYAFSYGIINKFTQGIQEAFSYIKKLDTSLNNIQIVTQHSSEEMAKFAENANKAAQALGTATTTYTDAALIYYQQGLSDAAAQERTDVTVKLANVMQTTASEVSQYMTSIWNNFDDGSESLEYYADVITNLGAHTASSSAEIAQGLEKFAAAADTAGLSYEYATSALATVVATTRQSADTVGTAFKTLFSRIQDLEQGDTLDDGTTLGTYSQALEKIGVNIMDNVGNVKDMDDILDEIGAKWDTLAKDQQLALAENVAGVRQYTQFIALMDNYDFFKENLEYAQDAEGTLEQQQETYMNSIAAHLQTLQAAKEELQGDLLNENTLKGGADILTNLVKTVDTFVDAFGDGNKALLAFGVIFAQVFNRQISKGITNAITNFQLLQENIAATEVKTRFLQNAEFQKGNTAVEANYNKQLELAQEIEQVRKGISQETYNELTVSQQLLGLYEERNVLEEEAAQKVLSEELAGNNLLNAKEELNAIIKKNITDEAEMTSQVSLLKENFNLSTEAAEKLEVIMQRVKNNCKDAYTTSKAFKETLDKASLQSNITQKIAGITSAISSATVAFMSLTSVINIWKNDSLSAGEKVAQTFMSLGMTVPMLISSMTSLMGMVNKTTNIEATEAESKAQDKATLATLRRTEAEKALEKSKAFARQMGVKDTENASNVVKQAKEVEIAKKEEAEAYRELAIAKGESTGTGGAENITEGIGTPEKITETVTNEALTTSEEEVAGAKGTTSVMNGIEQATEGEVIVSKEGDTVATLTLSGALKKLMADMAPVLATLAPWLALGAAVALLVVAIKKYREQAQKAADEAKENMETMQENANSVAEAYSTLKDSIESITDAENDLSKMAKGTTEWKEAVVELNNQILELVENYPKLAQYMSSDDGVLSISAEGYDAVLAQQQQAAIDSQNAAMQAQIDNNNAQNALSKQTLRRQINSESGMITINGSWENENDINNILAAYESNGGRHLTEDEIINAMYGDGNIDAGFVATAGKAGIESIKKALFGDAEDELDVMSNDTLDAINQLCDELSANTEANNVLKQQMASTAVQDTPEYTGLSKTDQDNVLNLITNDYDNLINETKTHVDLYTEEYLQKFAESQNGVSAKKDTYGGGVTVTDSEGNETEFNAEEYQNAIATVAVTEDLNTSIKDYTEQLNHIQDSLYKELELKNVKTYDNNRERLPEENENTTRRFTESLTSWSSGAIGNFDTVTEQDLEILEEILYDNSGELSTWGESFLNELGVDLDAFTESFNTVKEGSQKLSTNNNFKSNWVSEDNLTVGRRDTLVSLYGGTYSDGTQTAMSTYGQDDINILNEAFKDLHKAELNNVLDYIAEMGDVSSISTSELKKQLQEQLKGTGIEITDSFCETLKEATNANLQTYAQQMNSAFSKMSQSNWLNSITSAEELNKYAVDETEWQKEKDLIERNLYDEKTGQKTFQSQFYSGMDSSKKKSQNQNDFKEAAQFLIDKKLINNDEIAEIANKAISKTEKLTNEEATTLNDYIKDLADEAEYTAEEFKAEQEAAMTQLAQSATSLNDLSNLQAEGYITNDVAEKSAETVAKVEASNKGIDADAMTTYAEGLDGYFEDTENAEQAMYAFAVAAENAALGVDNLYDALEDYKDIVEDGNELNTKYAEGVSAIKTALAQVLDSDIANNLSDEFVSDTKNLKLMEKAIQGDKDAMDDLQEAAAIDYLSGLDYKGTEQEFTSLVDSINSQLDSLGSSASGDDPLISRLQSWVDQAGLTQDQIIALFDDLGYTVEFDSAPLEEQLDESVAAAGQAGKKMKESVANSYANTEVDMDVGTQKTTISPTTQEIEYTTWQPNADGGWSKVEATGTVEYGEYDYYQPIFGQTQSQTAGAESKTIKSITNSDVKWSTPTTSKGSSSSSSGSSKDKEDKEYKETLDKYVQEEQRVSDATAAIDQLDKAKDNLTGNALAETLEKENELLEQQTKAYKALRKARIADAKEQQAQLKYYGFTFNDSGEYTNYEKMRQKYENNVKNLTEKYNKNKTDANEEALDKAEQELDYIKQLIDDYNDDWDEIQNLNQEMLDNWYQELENNLEAYEAEIQIHLDLDEAEVEWNDFLNDINKDFTLKYEDRSSDITTAAQNYSLKQDEANRIKEEMDFVWSEREKAANNKSDYFSSASEAETKWKELLSDYEDNISSMQEYAEDVYNDLSDQIDDFGDQLSDINERLSTISETLDNQADLVGLLYGENSYALLDKIYNSQVEVLKAQTANYQKQYDYWKSIYDSQTEDNSIKENALEKMQDLQSDIESNTKDTVEAIKTAFENSVNQSITDYQATAFGAIGQMIGGQNNYGYGAYDLSDIKDQWERAKEQSDAYYDSVERVYQLSNLKSEYQDAIDSTDEISQQKELTSLMNEQLEMLANKENLSETDITLAEKRLAIAKAQMELEDAQNSKNTMQLVRDASGNYSYKYTANQSDVEEKTQALNDSINDLYEAQKQAATDAVDTAIDIQEKFAQAVQDIVDKYYGTDMFDSAYQAVYDQYFGEGGLAANSYAAMGYYSDEFGKGTAATVYGYTTTMSDTLNQFTDEQKELYQALADSGISSWSELWNSLDNGLVDVDTETEAALSSRGGGMQYYWNTAAGNIANMATKKTTEVKNAAKKMLNQIQDAQNEYKTQTEEVLESVGTSYEEYAETIGSVSDEIIALEDEQDALLEKIDETVPSMVETVSELTEQWNTTLTAVNSVTDAIESSFDSFDTLSQKIKTYTTDINAAADAASNFSAATSGDGGDGGTDDTGSEIPDSKDTKDSDKKAGKANKKATTYSIDEKAGATTSNGTATKYNTYAVRMHYMGKDNKEHYYTVGTFKTQAMGQNFQSDFYNRMKGMRVWANRIRNNDGWLFDKDTEIRRTDNYSKNADTSWKKLNLLEPYTTLKGKKGYYWNTSMVKQKNKKIDYAAFDTGGYTGEWGSNGKTAILHEKELVLNKTDTSKILDAVELVRNISNLGQSYLSNLSNNIANGLQNLMGINSNNNGQNIDQQVTINADFPNATNANEIEKALNNLTNIAIQHANS